MWLVLVVFLSSCFGSKRMLVSFWGERMLKQPSLSPWLLDYVSLCHCVSRYLTVMESIYLIHTHHHHHHHHDYCPDSYPLSALSHGCRLVGSLEILWHHQGQDHCLVASVKSFTTWLVYCLATWDMHISVATCYKQFVSFKANVINFITLPLNCE